MQYESFDISEVARRTGLSSRALRFYEARGLVMPLRSVSGRRHYGAGELERLHRVLALKRAGLSLADIGRILGNDVIDLARLLRKQIEAISRQAETLIDAKALLEHTLSRIDHGEPVDAATLCSLIQSGRHIMEDENWKLVIDDYFTPEEQARFGEKMTDIPLGFDQAAYGEKWRELGNRVEAALPLDPASDAAQAFVDQWFALLKPFSNVATPEMWTGTVRMYDGMQDWKASPDMGFGPSVWSFIREATKARLDAGGSVDGPAWLTGTR